jgi:hypothetical protein
MKGRGLGKKAVNYVVERRVKAKEQQQQQGAAAAAKAAPPANLHDVMAELKEAERVAAENSAAVNALLASQARESVSTAMVTKNRRSLAGDGRAPPPSLTSQSAVPGQVDPRSGRLSRVQYYDN